MRAYEFAFTDDVVTEYRKVFSSGSGQFVLAHMLHDLGVFREIGEDPEDVALRNFGVRVLSILAGGMPNGGSINEFTKRLMKQPLPKNKED